MFDLESKRDFDVYVSTLFALARDANAQNETDALRFLAKYLHGLVPPQELRELRLPPKPTAYSDLPPVKPVPEAPTIPGVTAHFVDLPPSPVRTPGTRPLRGPHLDVAPRQSATLTTKNTKKFRMG